MTDLDPALAYDVTQFDRPSVTADIVIFTLRHRTLQVLLIQRKGWPFEGLWAIPGGFVRMNESLEEAAERELREETGVTDTVLEQLHAYGDPGRDPRTRVITIAFTALIPSDRIILRADTDAADANWFPIDDLPLPLAFDHIKILNEAHQALRAKVEAGYVARGLLPARFTLTQLQEVYETLLGRDLDKRNFRKWILSLGILAQTTEEVRGAHRPAALYEFAG